MKPRFDFNDCTIVGQETVYNGFFKMNKLRLKHKTFDGGETAEFSRELLERGDASAVLLFDPQRDQIGLLEQFRVGALNNPRSPWLLELVAGMIEPGESAEQVAIRETQEEANLQIQQLEKICQYYVSPGGTSERISIYCALIDSDQLGGIHGLDSEMEDIQVHVVSRQKAMQLLAEGVINNAATIIALQWLALNQPRLKTEHSQ